MAVLVEARADSVSRELVPVGEGTSEQERHTGRAGTERSVSRRLRLAQWWPDRSDAVALRQLPDRL